MADKSELRSGSGCPMSDPYWAISVEVDGEQVVSVAPDCVSGRDMSAEDRQVVCRALRNLAAFVGCEELEQ